MFAEKRPAGFAFSDTAFRIFVLMASRRLNSDRFFTDYFTPEVYSPVGYQWVVDNDFTSVLLRHWPQLRSTLAGVANPFAPWRPATPSLGACRQRADCPAHAAASPACACRRRCR